MNQVSPEHAYPLPRSLSLLAEITVHAAGALGYAIYQIDPCSGRRDLRAAAGAEVPESSGKGWVVHSLPLQMGDAVQGALALVFRGPLPESSRMMVERMARSMEAVWRLTSVPGDYARGAARIGEMESELADSKIADRVRGILAEEGAPVSSDALEAIVRHVETVLRPGHLGMAIQDAGERAEREIAERELARRAKAILQSRYGMSEDQAHAHLRLLSRKSRKRLRDVARDVLRGTRPGADLGRTRNG